MTKRYLVWLKDSNDNNWRTVASIKGGMTLDAITQIEKEFSDLKGVKVTVLSFSFLDGESRKTDCM